MKKLLMIAVLAAALTALLVTSAFADTTTPPMRNQAGAGFGQGRGIHAPGTGMGAGMRGTMRGGAPEWAGMNDAAAVLGLTVEQLRAERQAGKSLVQIAAAKGISQDALIATLLEARKATVAELLAAGKITQAQADYMLSEMTERMTQMVQRTNTGRPDFAGQGPMAGTGRGRNR